MNCFASEISFLGFAISKEGIKVSPDKIVPVLEAPEPQNVFYLKSFLGMAAFYYKHIPGLPMKSPHIRKLLMKGSK